MWLRDNRAGRFLLGWFAGQASRSRNLAHWSLSTAMLSRNAGL
jgi:hypothetical protein